MAKIRNLFTPFSLKNLELKNRIVMPPMCQYSATDGDADLVAVGRGLLRDPYWVLNAQYQQNGADSSEMQFVPRQYQRGFM